MTNVLLGEGRRVRGDDAVGLGVKGRDPHMKTVDVVGEVGTTRREGALQFRSW